MRSLLVAMITFIPMAAMAEVYNNVVPSNSMYPTLIMGDLIGSSTYLEDEPVKRGDIIISTKNTNDTRTIFVHRVIGLPGEKIQIKKGVVYIDDQPLKLVKIDNLPDINCPVDVFGTEQSCTFFREFAPNNSESHIVVSQNDDSLGDNTEVFHVPGNHYFMMGDNRDNSDDSRFTSGPLPKDKILGKVRMIYHSETPGDKNERFKGFPRLK